MTGPPSHPYHLGVVAPRTLHRYTYQEYMALEDASTTKHEFLEGEIYAMAGGTPEHAALSFAVGAALHDAKLAADCRVYSSDLRVRVQSTGLTTYPDVTIVCGPAERDALDPNAVVNPALIVEVLSPSTEAYDRGEKLEHYKKVPSLRAVLLVSHPHQEIEAWTRNRDTSWASTRETDGVLHLPAFGVSLHPTAIYHDAGLRSSPH